MRTFEGAAVGDEKQGASHSLPRTFGHKCRLNAALGEVWRRERQKLKVFEMVLEDLRA